MRKQEIKIVTVIQSEKVNVILYTSQKAFVPKPGLFLSFYSTGDCNINMKQITDIILYICIQFVDQLILNSGYLLSYLIHVVERSSRSNGVDKSRNNRHSRC